VRRKTNSVFTDMPQQPIPTELFPTVLTRHDEISPGVYVIGYKRDHDFSPGQAIKLGVDTETPPRIYSICSGVEDDELCILFNVKAEGYLTPKLAQLKCGDTIYISNPYGTFLCPDKKAWWIATGTGIAPFRCMVQSGMAEGKTLVHGVRHLNQFYFEDELRGASGLDYHPCCSAESDAPSYHGRVTSFLDQLPTLPTDVRYYICGQAAMAVDTRDLLIQKGVPFTHIVTEIYF
jgi:ferredoxin--NADP+ reductase